MKLIDYTTLVADIGAAFDTSSTRHGGDAILYLSGILGHEKYMAVLEKAISLLKAECSPSSLEHNHGDGHIHASSGSRRFLLRALAETIQIEQ